MTEIFSSQHGWYKDGRAYLRCPECRRENYAPAVARGQCAWCGWKMPDEAKKEGGA